MKKLLWIGLALLVVLVGCNLTGRDFYRDEGELFDPTKGSVVLVINGGSIATTKTLTPDMDVVKYVLTWDGPNASDDGTETITSTANISFVRSGLSTGAWSVIVNALNSNDDIIGGTGGVLNYQNDFTVDPGGTAVVDIEVTPITVDSLGDLRIFVSWPTNAGSSVTITGSLINSSDVSTSIWTDATGTDASGTTSVEYDSGTAGTFAVGYYTLILQLNDVGGQIWGLSEAVRITDTLKTDTNNASTGEKFELTLNPSGTLNFTETTNMNNPVAITLPSIPDFSVGVGSPLSETATTNPTADGYKWYLDGTLIANNSVPGEEVTGADSATLSIVATSSLLTLGTHNLSLLATLGTTISSETVGFNVTP